MHLDRSRTALILACIGCILNWGCNYCFAAGVRHFFETGWIYVHPTQTNIGASAPANGALGVVFGTEVDGMQLGSVARQVTNASGIALDITLVLQNHGPEDKYYLQFASVDPFEFVLKKSDSSIVQLTTTQLERWEYSRKETGSLLIFAGNQVTHRIALPLMGKVTTEGDHDFIALARIPRGEVQKEAELRAIPQRFHFTTDDLKRIEELANTNNKSPIVIEPVLRKYIPLNITSLPSATVTSSVSPKAAAGANATSASNSEFSGRLSALVWLSIGVLVAGGILLFFLLRRKP